MVIAGGVPVVPPLRARVFSASTEPAMVIAGGAQGQGIQARNVRAASTEPAMVIAGGRLDDDGGRGRAHGFNGAGDGDRRRAACARPLRAMPRCASTEPAMVIAGGRSGHVDHDGGRRASTEPAMVIAGGRTEPSAARPRPSSFNGAGDGDRRRAWRRRRGSDRSRWLQRSRRW